MITKYTNDWTKIDGGREGLWAPNKWLTTLQIIARHQGEDEYNQDAPIYEELKTLIPDEPWFKGSEKGRTLFRDYSHPWTVSGLIRLDGQKFFLTERGNNLVKNTISPSEAMLQFFCEYSETSEGSNVEKPFSILCQALLTAHKTLTLGQIYWGIEKNYRPGVDDIATVLAVLPSTLPDIDQVPKRRLDLMLDLLERCGVIVGVPDNVRVWNFDLANRIAGSSEGVASHESTMLKDMMPEFEADLARPEVGVKVDDVIATRICAALLSKRFLIFCGLSGSGKTKLAQAFSRWITKDPGWVESADHSKGKHVNPFYTLVPVGADWTGNDNVLGYPNGLDGKRYITKPTLEIILHALNNLDAPHFLVLDEMNLSHVERYFADILSVIESEEGLDLYSGDMSKPDTWRVKDESMKVPPKIRRLPENLFIIGTVNVDETTYMFSPKVLDRANVIEFRMDAGELETFLSNPTKPNLSELDGKGVSYSKSFVKAANSSADVPSIVKSQYSAEILLFFNTMQANGAEFGYRLAHDTARFIHFYKLLGRHSESDPAWFQGAFDCVVFQKLLPKLHGSRTKLGPLLKKLWFLSVNDKTARGADALKAAAESATSTDKKNEPSAEVPSGAPYPLSADKIARMWRLLNDNGFASFAEA